MAALAKSVLTDPSSAGPSSLSAAAGPATRGVVIAIGGVPVRMNTADVGFLELLRTRYDGFIDDHEVAEFEFDFDLTWPLHADPDTEVRVTCDAGRWLLERSDFSAELDLSARRGFIRQSANPYSIDAILRIVHTLVLAKQGGFLLHAASAIRNGKAFLFAGVSGAGKTTIARLAPADATLLTDEISYIRKCGDAYVAYGTPFTGELAKLGENASAPVGLLYFLEQGPENRIDDVDAGDAGRELLANTLFFAEDQEMVQRAFQAACDFVDHVPVRRLTFVPDARVWEMIG